MKKLLFVIVLGIVLCAVAPSCGSKRHASRPSRPSERVESVKLRSSDDIVAEAKRWLGTPYRYGGKERRRGTDCSGMVMTIYLDKAGLKLPRNSARQQEFCRRIDRDRLAPGDLVFFRSSRRGGKVSHVGIYTGNGEFIHASSSRGVMVSRLDQEYFASHFHSAGRVLEVAGKRRADAPAPTTAPAPTPVPEPTPAPSPLPVAMPAVAPVELPESVAVAVEVAEELPDSYENKMIRAELALDSLINELTDSLSAMEPDTISVGNCSPE